MPKTVSGETVAQENASRQKAPQRDIKTGHEVPTQGARAAFGLPLLLLMVVIVGAILAMVLYGL